MISRDNYLLKINILLKSHPVVALIGPRQVGKTTLAREIAKQYYSVTLFDLEDPTSLSRLQDPMLVKAPKIYINDSGLLHTLLGLNNKEELESHPKIGASWEGFAINAVLEQLNAQTEETFFWSTYSGAEIDLVIMHGNTRLGFEFKRTTAPTLTRSCRTALEDLKLSHVYVVYAGNETYPLAPDVTALGLSNIVSQLSALI